MHKHIKITLAIITTLLFSGYSLPTLATDISANFPVYVTPSFETAGFLVTQPDNQIYVSGEVYFKGPDNKMRISHPLVKYDLKNFATSLFELSPGVGYDARVVMTAATGHKYYRDIPFITRANINIPTAVRTINVSTSNELQQAIRTAVGGDYIQLAAGNYDAITLANKHFTDARPLVIRAYPGATRPRIIGDGFDGNSGVFLENVTNVVISGFEILNGGSYESASGGGGKGVFLRASAKVTIHNNIIHDNGGHGILVSSDNQYTGPGGFAAAGHHLILNNTLYDSQFARDCGGDLSQHEACLNQAYYGILMQNNPGAGTVIRGNTITGHVDSISPCGNEKEVGIVSANHVLIETDPNRRARYNNHDLEIYDNVLDNSRDDAIELDGICVNARVYRNKITRFTNNVFSIAPALPGPYFILRNIIDADWVAGSVKLNTLGPVSEPLRNVFIYHNTFIRNNFAEGNEGALLNLFINSPNMPLNNINFRNNIFYAKQGGRSITGTGNFNKAIYPSFNNNLWANQDSTLFGWHTYSGLSFAAWQVESKQESQGLFTTNSPGLDKKTYRPLTGSLAIDRAIRIPGINDYYHKAAPDIGAVEN